MSIENQNHRRAICKFLLDDIICCYGCVKKITIDRGELDVKKSRKLFFILGIKLSLTTAYNCESNGNSERGHAPIIKALPKACEERIGEWLKLVPYALWRIIQHIA